MARSDPQMNFRIPAELKAQLEEVAKMNKRSLTAELVSRLNDSLNRDDYNNDKDIHNKLDNIYSLLVKNTL